MIVVLFETANVFLYHVCFYYFSLLVLLPQLIHLSHNFGGECVKADFLLNVDGLTFFILVCEQKADDTSGLAVNAEVEELLVESFEVKWSTELYFFWFSRDHFGVVAWFVGWFLLPRVAIADFKVDPPCITTFFLIFFGNVRNEQPPGKRLLRNVNFEKHEGFWNNNCVLSPVACLHLNVGFVIILVAH